MVGDALILTVVAISVPWLASILVAVNCRQTRVIGFVAASVSVLSSTLLLLAAPAGESLYQALMVLFSCLALGATLVIPRRDCNPGAIAGILFLLGSTLLAYSTQNLLVLLVAWILSTIPFCLVHWLRAQSWRPQAALLLSSIALALGIALIAANGHAISIGGLKGRSPGGMAAFGLLVVAVIFRKGVCPAHAWVADAAEGGPAIPTALLLNGHFGALLVAKLIVPLFPNTARNLFPVLSYLAIATALYVAVRALTENSPRRLLAFLALSQSACILAGLESRTSEGITGALVHWFVVTVSTMGLFGILRLLEVRFGENLTASRHLGLAEHAPRLAVFFVVFGLALVGLPGTLSFCSQDLLIHGTLASHPLTGLLLPIATAMNAVSVFRLFTRLFLGKRRTGFTLMADALPRERWILTAGVLFVVLGGLFPNVIVAQRSGEAETVEQAIPAPAPPHDAVQVIGPGLSANSWVDIEDVGHAFGDNPTHAISKSRELQDAQSAASAYTQNWAIQRISSARNRASHIVDPGRDVVPPPVERKVPSVMATATSTPGEKPTSFLPLNQRPRDGLAFSFQWWNSESTRFESVVVTASAGRSASIAVGKKRECLKASSSE